VTFTLKNNIFNLAAAFVDALDDEFRLLGRDNSID
jgi:hypothetical protein